ncbi:MAG TPA: TIGR00266 family protein [Dongiaceae bacterium]|nr:TIGR00266 family protein [Dongiaceae bacterium]
MKYQISGTTMQTVEIDLAPGETVYSQTHAVAWMNDRINMETNTGGGFFAGLKRSLGGGSFFVTNFTADGAAAAKPGHVAFAPRFPGTIIARELAAGESLICRKETFLCAEKSVTLELAFQQRLGAGLFGGEGFILQKVTGPGTVWLDLSGEVVEKDLDRDDTLLVHVGHVGVQTPGIQFDIRMIRGFRNVLFGGEGLFLAELRGPGKVWLQSMPIMNLAEEIGRHLPGRGEGGSTATGSALGGAVAGGAGAVIGGLLGGLFNGGDSDNS